MNARRSFDGRGRASVVILVLLAVVLPGPAARAQQSPPQVWVSVDDDATVTITQACDGSIRSESSAIVFFLLAPDNPPETPVNLSWSGSLATDGGTEQYDGSIDSLPSEVVLNPSLGDAALGMFVTRGGDLTLTIEPGDGYTVGTPSAATATLTATTVTIPCPSTPARPATPASSTPPSAEPRNGVIEPPAAVPLAASATYTG